MARTELGRKDSIREKGMNWLKVNFLRRDQNGIWPPTNIGLALFFILVSLVTSGIAFAVYLAGGLVAIPIGLMLLVAFVGIFPGSLSKDSYFHD